VENDPQLNKDLRIQLTLAYITSIFEDPDLDKDFKNAFFIKVIDLKNKY